MFEEFFWEACVVLLYFGSASSYDGTDPQITQITQTNYVPEQLHY